MSQADVLNVVPCPCLVYHAVGGVAENPRPKLKRANTREDKELMDEDKEHRH